jgi:hypothetical protein
VNIAKVFEQSVFRMIEVVEPEPARLSLTCLPSSSYFNARHKN